MPSFWDKAKLVAKGKAPEPTDYIGRPVVIKEFGIIDGKKVVLSQEKVTIWEITPMIHDPMYYIINGVHKISVIRFYDQMNKSKLSEEEMEAFEDMQLHVGKAQEKKDVH